MLIGAAAIGSRAIAASSPAIARAQETFLREGADRQTLYHHFVYGQSNAALAGVKGEYVGELTKLPVAPGRALMFSNGVFPNFTKLATFNGTPTEQAAPITAGEMVGFVDAYYGGDRVDMEAPGLGFAELYCAAHPDRRLLISDHSVAGWGISQLGKGSQPYANIIAASEAAQRDALALGLAYRLLEIDFRHGETDFQSETYQADVTKLMADLDQDLSARLGEVVNVPWFATQVANWTADPGGDAAHSKSALEQLALHEANPGKYTLYCPTYFIPYGAGPPPFQSIHMDAYGVRLRDEYAAKARATIDATGRFNPLRPVEIRAEDRTITIKFVGGKGLLKWNIFHAATNPNGVSNPGNYGFELFDDGGARITNVSIVNNNVLINTDITVSNNYKIGYAWTGISGAFPGPITGPRGCLSDTDVTPPSSVIQRHRELAFGQTGVSKSASLVNWCVAFLKVGT